MNKSKREAIRDQRDALKAYKAESARAKAEEQAKAEAKLQARFKETRRYEGRPSLLDPYGSAIYKKAPKLLTHPVYREVVQDMGRWHGHLRPIKDWEPRGKGGESLFRSLCEHLWAKYPMPAFLWSAFLEASAQAGQYQNPVELGAGWLVQLVRDVAAGGSLFTYSKERRFPVLLTRAMAHDLMAKTPGDISFTRAVRRVQVKTAGGSPRLFGVWADLRPGKQLGTPAQEDFWATVIVWLAQNPMLDPTQIGPLTDYLSYRRNQDPTFSMKGRSALALLRGMQEWHGTLNKVKVSRQDQQYKPTGWKDHEEETEGRTGSGNFIKTAWRIQEILSYKDLVEEGRVLHHCVASYGWRVETGDISIWSMNTEQVGIESRVCTIEVDNRSRIIVQARGHCNRQVTSDQFQVMQRWAGLNGLTIGRLGVW